jgi:hypothetical protein
MRSLLLFAGLSMVTASAIAQTEGSAFTLTGHGVATPFARDYQCLGINPANLDLPEQYEGKRYTMGYMELGVSIYSEALSRDQVRQNIFRNRLQDLTADQKRDLAFEFANSANSADFDLMTGGFAVQTNKLGSFAISIRERMDFYSKMGPQASEILWMGFNAPYFEELVLENGDTIPNTGDLDEETLNQVVQGITSLSNAQSVNDLMRGTKYRFSWVREINIGYGKRLLSGETWELHGGAGVKFLIGQGILELDATGDEATVYSSLAPVFDIDYGDFENASNGQLPSDAGPLAPVGFGIGVDLGATLAIKNKLFASAAITDIGSMKWKGNLYELNDAPLTSIASVGFDNIAFIDQVQSIGGAEGLVQWTGGSERVTALPTTGRFGLALALEKIRAGVDVVAPFNGEVGSLDQSVVAVGGEFSPVPWLHLQGGFMQGGNYDTKIPAGIRITLNEGAHEFGIASRDMITFFTDNEPTASFTLGFLRFRF